MQFYFLPFFFPFGGVVGGSGGLTGSGDLYNIVYVFFKN